MAVTWTIDPRKITERLFGGPHFAPFHDLGGGIMQCVKSGDKFFWRDVLDGWATGRNVLPVAAGEEIPQWLADQMPACMGAK